MSRMKRTAGSGHSLASVREIRSSSFASKLLDIGAKQFPVLAAKVLEGRRERRCRLTGGAAFKRRQAEEDLSQFVAVAPNRGRLGARFPGLLNRFQFGHEGASIH